MSGPAVPDFALNDALRAGDELPQGVRLRVAIDVLVQLRDEGAALEPRSATSRLHLGRIVVGDAVRVVGDGDASGVVVLLWEILSARPAEGESLPRVHEVVDEIPPDVDDVVANALDGGIESVEALVEELERAAEGHVSPRDEVLETLRDRYLVNTGAKPPPKPASRVAAPKSPPKPAPIVEAKADTSAREEPAPPKAEPDVAVSPEVATPSPAVDEGSPKENATSPTEAAGASNEETPVAEETRSAIEDPSLNVEARAAIEAAPSPEAAPSLEEETASGVPTAPSPGEERPTSVETAAPPEVETAATVEEKPPSAKAETVVPIELASAETAAPPEVETAAPVEEKAPSAKAETVVPIEPGQAAALEAEAPSIGLKTPSIDAGATKHEEEKAPSALAEAPELLTKAQADEAKIAEPYGKSRLARGKLSAGEATMGAKALGKGAKSSTRPPPARPDPPKGKRPTLRPPPGPAPSTFRAIPPLPKPPPVPAPTPAVVSAPPVLEASLSDWDDEPTHVAFQPPPPKIDPPSAKPPPIQAPEIPALDEGLLDDWDVAPTLITRPPGGPAMRRVSSGPPGVKLPDSSPLPQMFVESADEEDAAPSSDEWDEPTVRKMINQAFLEEVINARRARGIGPSTPPPAEATATGAMPSVLLFVGRGNAPLVRALGDAGYQIDMGQGAADVNAVKPGLRCVVIDVEAHPNAKALIEPIRSGPMNAVPMVVLAPANTKKILEAFLVAADACIPKPYRPEDVVAQIGALVRMSRRIERAQAANAKAFTGDLALVSLSTVLTIVGLERRTGVFEVSSPDSARTSIDIVLGYVTGGAIAGGAVASVDALRAMMQTQRGRFTFRVAPDADPPSDSIPLREMLLDVVRAMDEASRDEAARGVASPGVQRT